jgi:hypothetical protein
MFSIHSEEVLMWQRWSIPFGASFLAVALAGPLSAQESPQPVPCKTRPCEVFVDWTREGGVAAMTPDRRYGNPAQFEEWLKAALTERGYPLHASTDTDVVRIVLQPSIDNAICDQLPGTATDMSCRAVTDVQARVEGPDALTDGIDLPSRIRNRCGSDQLMPVDRLATFVAEYIIYAVEGKAKGERRPVGRC